MLASPEDASRAERPFGGPAGEPLTGDTQGFALSGGATVFPPSPSFLGSVFATDGAAEEFDLLVLGGMVPLSRGPWTQALLAHLAGLLNEQGALAVPEESLAPSPGIGSLAASELESMLSSTAHSARNGYVLFERPRPSQPGPSVLSWMLRDTPGRVHAFLLARLFRQTVSVAGLDDMLLELLYDGAEEIVTSPRRRLAQAGFTGGDRWFDHPAEGASLEVVYGAAYADALDQLATQVVDAGRLAGLLRLLLEERSFAGHPRVLQLGGGFGLTTAEIVLDPALGEVAGVTVDRVSTHPSMALNLYRLYRNRLAGRWYLSPRAPEDFDLDQTYTHILISTRLDRGEEGSRAALLERCWSSVSPGGALIFEHWPATDAMPEVEPVLREAEAIRRFHPWHLHASPPEPGPGDPLVAAIKPER